MGSAGWDPLRASTRGEIAQVLYNLRERSRPGAVLFSDNLAVSSDNWKTVSNGPGLFRFDSAAYVGEVPAGNQGSEVRTKLSAIFVDFSAEVTATALSGEAVGFGMCVRADQTSGDPTIHGGFKFEVMPNGQVQWWEYGSGGQQLDHGEAVLSAAAGGLVAAGMAPLKLGIECKPDFTSFSVNGQQVGKVTTSAESPKSGAVSLFVDNKGASAVKVAFSDFVIKNTGTARSFSLTVNAIDKSGTLVGARCTPAI